MGIKYLEKYTKTGQIKIYLRKKKKQLFNYKKTLKIRSKNEKIKEKKRNKFL